MKLGDGVETAIHCVAVLAGLTDGAVMPTAALAEHYDVSPSYLAKHLKALVAGHVLVSVPGPAGGYQLAKDPAEISLLDVVLAIEGRDPAFRCKDIRRNGPCVPDDSAFPKPCGIKRAMLKAEQTYRAELAAVSIQDLVTDFQETSDTRVIARGENFIAENERPKKL